MLLATALRARGETFPVTPEVSPLKCHAENSSHALVVEPGVWVTLAQRDLTKTRASQASRVFALALKTEQKNGGEGGQVPGGLGRAGVGLSLRVGGVSGRAPPALCPSEHSPVAAAAVLRGYQLPTSLLTPRHARDEERAAGGAKPGGPGVLSR